MRKYYKADVKFKKLVQNKAINEQCFLHGDTKIDPIMWEYKAKRVMKF